MMTSPAARTSGGALGTTCGCGSGSFSSPGGPMPAEASPYPSNGRGYNDDVAGGGLVEEPWVRLADADQEAFPPQEVQCHQKLHRTHPPLQ
ncbi:hypothetical protein TIFTF001_055345 [Ficus carica]|uniref:Uncharacterized protein n=2 Tax=Ficus carica TaxID=3494 RepID=A0AA88EL20_FICCA|nr:hypothetical protein TIFTF001_055342 [Ficus carica]GMN73471.1 hypothetical protein TIFTF001_055345 [Ficus carica]